MSSMGYEAKNNLTDLFVFQGKLFFKDHFYFEFQSQCFARTGIQKRNLKKRKKTNKETSRCNLIIHNQEGLNFS